jgi:hypothetical protein
VLERAMAASAGRGRASLRGGGNRRNGRARLQPLAGWLPSRAARSPTPAHRCSDTASLLCPHPLRLEAHDSAATMVLTLPSAGGRAGCDRANGRRGRRSPPAHAAAGAHPAALPAAVRPQPCGERRLAATSRVGGGVGVAQPRKRRVLRQRLRAGGVGRACRRRGRACGCSCCGRPTGQACAAAAGGCEG